MRTLFFFIVAQLFGSSALAYRDPIRCHLTAFVRDADGSYRDQDTVRKFFQMYLWEDPLERGTFRTHWETVYLTNTAQVQVRAFVWKGPYLDTIQVRANLEHINSQGLWESKGFKISETQDFHRNARESYLVLDQINNFDIINAEPARQINSLILRCSP